ncbi:MAG: DNA-directed RNA polymerase subunit beta [Candidatus Stahlbacteria bacterium]|nr:DNA-directed RNA polymerase subunit beta [Candidatus Stahlbacteria bacterium]
MSLWLIGDFMIKRYDKIKEKPGLIGDLIGVQLESWNKFLQLEVPPDQRKSEGLQGVFHEAFPIEDSRSRYRMEFISYAIGKPDYSPQEAIERGISYSAPLRADFKFSVREDNSDMRESNTQNVYLCRFPLMTDWGTFIINGVERVIVNQLRRAPGVYYAEEIHPSGKRLFIGEIIPYHGSWIKLSTDMNDILWVALTRRHKILCTTLLLALGYEKLEDILKLFFTTEFRNVEETTRLLGYVLARDVIKSGMERETRKQKEVRPQARGKKQGKKIEVDPSVIARAGDKIDEDLLATFIDFEIDKVEVLTDKFPPLILSTYAKEKYVSQDKALLHIYSLLKGISIHDVSVAQSFFNTMFFTPAMYNLHKIGRHKINRRFGTKITSTSLTNDDFLNVIRGMFSLYRGEMPIDDPDHLGNRHLRRVGELLEDQFRIAFSRLAWIVRERMVLKESEKITPRTIINPIVVNAVLDSFFSTSQLSQFMEQTNPLAELTHKRRVSRLGPGGLTRQTAGLESRDVHHSQYGRLCPIETPEGQNVGIITSLATYGRINEFGEIETPYYRVKKGRVEDKIDYLTADEEDKFTIAQINTPTDTKGLITSSLVLARRRGDYPIVEPNEVNYMDISPRQFVAVSTSLVPFLEHDDADRALMGANMQRQGVPLLFPEVPIVRTGVEEEVAVRSRAIVVAKHKGMVLKADGSEIIVKCSEGDGVDYYPLIKFRHTNQDTSINQQVRVKVGDVVNPGDLIADGVATKDGKLALGKNLLVAFLPWRGYNFEDAIVLSEDLLRRESFSSVTIQKFEVEVRDTAVGPEEVTSDIPNIPPEALRNLDKYGVVRIGAEVEADDILVGKISPKGEREYSPEEKLLQAIFGEKAQDVKDTSLCVPSGVRGVVIDVRILSRKSEDPLYVREVESRKDKIRQCNSQLIDALKRTKLKKADLERYVNKIKKEEKLIIEKYERGDALSHGVLKKIMIFVAQHRQVMVGDKLSGRHGNKGTVSKIVPREDMPHLADGTSVDICLNPLGVPSRMNIGQILETHLGWAAHSLGFEAVTPVFNGATIDEIKAELKHAGLPEDGKTILFDGRTGEQFSERVVVGYVYMMKLIHMVEDKLHARSIGSYALITQQPLGGKAQAGGQRFGEMEVWALEGYVAAYTLDEMLTIKSDDISGRRGLYESIIKGLKFPEPREPLSFNVLLRELNALGLETELIKEDKNE